MIRIHTIQRSVVVIALAAWASVAVAVVPARAVQPVSTVLGAGAVTQAGQTQQNSQPQGQTPQAGPAGEKPPRAGGRPRPQNPPGTGAEPAGGAEPEQGGAQQDGAGEEPTPQIDAQAQAAAAKAEARATAAAQARAAAEAQAAADAAAVAAELEARAAAMARQQQAAAERMAEAEAAWEVAIARDRTLAFTRSTARKAIEELQAGFGDEFERSAALYALGATDAVDQLGLLEGTAQAGSGFEQLAAILALGELSLPPVDLLLRLLADPRNEVRGAVVLALMRTDDDRANAQIEPIALGRGPLGRLVSDLIVFVRKPEESVPSAPASLLLSLRWEAAKRYGLVDGRTWRAARIAALEEDKVFLDSVLLPAAASGRWPSIRDHLVAMLIEEPSLAVYEACLEALPAEFNLLVRNGIWTPSSPEQWQELVLALERRGGSPELIDIYDRATGVTSLRVRAAALLLVAGDPRGWDTLAPLLASDVPARRQLVAVAMGRSGDRSWISELVRLERDKDPDVRATALAARIALGELLALDIAESIIADQTNEDRPFLARALVEVAEDGRVQRLLEQALVFAESPLSIEVAVALAEQGRLSARPILREALERREAPSLQPRIVRALAGYADQGDLIRLREMFPSDGNAALDLELARALVLGRDGLGLRLVRAGVWTRDFHRSVLAGHLLADFQGIQALYEELKSPPPRVSAADLRRIGFVLGELGGVGEVENLARRRTSADPVLQGAYLGALAARTY
ncbi:hypothetical protein [Engelhardtia mirabilis]|uniref:HEAT repeat protein n=1 Tax=Engelhardtia mirabilis TaxID=2528011 RepID=A0A518BJX8_9BACT|nr:hypothetical protein Pla133_23500 [Planctomycetes bacterium Pla133]QDV01597.1 hypothetical protein Pla86_23490 [Planctomycetes bacterium Pla86]